MVAKSRPQKLSISRPINCHITPLRFTNITSNRMNWIPKKNKWHLQWKSI